MTESSHSRTPAPGPDTTTIHAVAEVISQAGQRQLSPEESAAVHALPPRTALLIERQAPGTASRYLLDTDEVTVGRHPKADVFLDDVTVSRRHARFVRKEGGYELIDAGSLNGTYVNGDRVDVAPLRTGDAVRLGKFEFVVHLAPAHS